MAGLGFCPNAASVAVDHALHGSQSDAASREFGVAVQALKWAEQVTRICHIEAYAVVANREDSLAFALDGVKLNMRISCLLYTSRCV